MGHPQSGDRAIIDRQVTIPHAIINLGQEPCMLINAVIRHGRAHPFDYHPRKAPFMYHFDRLNRLVSNWEDRIAA